MRSVSLRALVILALCAGANLGVQRRSCPGGVAATALSVPAPGPHAGAVPGSVLVPMDVLQPAAPTLVMEQLANFTHNASFEAKTTAVAERKAQAPTLCIYSIAYNEIKHVDAFMAANQVRDYN